MIASLLAGVILQVQRLNPRMGNFRTGRVSIVAMVPVNMCCGSRGHEAHKLLAVLLQLLLISSGNVGLTLAQDQGPDGVVSLDGEVFDMAWTPVVGAKVSLINYADCGVRSSTTNN